MQSTLHPLEWKKSWWIWILTLTLSYFPIFYMLDAAAIYQWDESRLATNAYEMWKNGNWLVTYFEGNPDMWNTKPPLMIWFQVFCMHILGPTELAVRMPSALAAVFTVILLLWFFKRMFNSYLTGFIAAMVLITSWGYIELHSSRTGDYDALLAFTTTGFLFHFLIYLHTNNRRYLLWFSIFLYLSVMTKSAASLMFGPALLVFLLVYSRKTFLDKSVYFYTVLALAAASAYFFLREIYNPGYLAAVNENDFSGRFGKAIPPHFQPFLHYFNNLRDTRYSYYFVILLATLPIGFFAKDKVFKLTMVYLSIVMVLFWLVLSMGATRIYWYDTPLYPLMAAFLALVFHLFIKLIQKLQTDTIGFSKSWVVFAFMIFVFFKPYGAILTKVQTAATFPWEEKTVSIADFFKNVANGKENIEGFVYSEHTSYIPHVRFYMDRLRDEKGEVVPFKIIDSLTVGDKVISPSVYMHGRINAIFVTDTLNTISDIHFYKLVALKDSTSLKP